MYYLDKVKDGRGPTRSQISFKDADGHRVQGDWVCSFQIRNGAPVDPVAFVQ